MKRKQSLGKRNESLQTASNAGLQFSGFGKMLSLTNLFLHTRQLIQQSAVISWTNMRQLSTRNVQQFQSQGSCLLSRHCKSAHVFADASKFTETLLACSSMQNQIQASICVRACSTFRFPPVLFSLKFVG